MQFDILTWNSQFYQQIVGIFLPLVHEQYGSVPASPPRLYHYTGAQGVKGIISSGKLRASHIYYMNDESEYTHAIDLMDQTTRAQQNRLPPVLIDAIIGNLDSARTIEGALPIFVTSFSEKQNDLSQWRAYGQGEGGFSIGFSLLELQKSTGYLLPCIYQSNLQQRFAEQALQKLLAEWTLHVSHLPLTTQKSVTENLVFAAFKQLALFAAALKNPDFQTEKEWRLIFQQSDPNKIIIQPKKDLLSGYIEPQLFNNGTPLPITELWIGPGRYQRLSYAAAKVLLNQNNFARVDIFSSKIPYRVISGA
jgi:hypothetical protein